MMFILINILLSISFVENAIIVSLNDYAQWYILAQDKTLIDNEALAVKMPNGIYSAFIEDRTLPKDYFINNFHDVGFRWIGKNGWIYGLWFSVDKSILEAPYTEIVFHGIDGIAHIIFNSVEIGVTENSFVTYRYDVTKILVEGENRLFVRLDPSTSIPEEINMEKLLFSKNVSKWNGEENVNFLRRMQASFGSDFGPAFPSLGLWKDVELIAYQNEIIIRDIAVSTVPYNENWRVEVTLYNESRVHDFDSMKGIFTIRFILENDEEIEFSREIEFPKESPNNTIPFKEFLFKVSIPKTYVKEWWPNGYGNQNLYKLTAIFKSKSCTNEKTIKIGFRTVSLEQSQVDPLEPSLGLSFYFTVNHVPIFVKGANLLPIDMFPEKALDEKTIEYLIRSAKLANMNMLRVNGLGIYQSDYFYQLCDENGILVWQDMMFSTYVYPDTNRFLENVAVEVRQQIERLQYHPSIITWVGIADFRLATNNMLRFSARLNSMYEKVTRNLIRSAITKIISSIDRTRPCLDSIPVFENIIYSGYNGSKYPYRDPTIIVREHNDNWLTDYYPVVRFAYEYGVQSFPSFSTLKKVASDEDLSSIDSKFLQYRQHALDEEGNMRILRFIGYHFGKLDPNDVENIIYISQIEQAWTVKLKTEWFRTWRNKILPSGKGNTMGVLYWHLNDVWHAPTWSSIEYGGKWKILHYYAKKFFSPILVSINTNIAEEVTINLTSDLIEDRKATLKMEIFKWDSMNAVSVTTYPVFLEMEKTITYMNTTLPHIFSVPSCSSKGDSYKKNCFLKVTLFKKKNIFSDSYLFPNYFKDLVGLQDAKVEAKVTSCNSKVCNLLIKTDAIALFVWLDIQDKMGYFSDNGFIMTEPEKEIIFYSENEIEVEEAQSLVTVKILSKSLLDSLSE